MRSAATDRRSIIFALVISMLATACGSPETGRTSADTSIDAATMQVGMDEALSISGLGDRFIAIGSQLAKLTKENAPGAGAAFSDKLILVRSCEMRPFASAWGKLDPEVALDYAVNLRRVGSQRRREAISEVLVSWVALDEGKGAKEYLASLRQGSEDRQVVLNNTIMGLGAAGYPDEAIPLLASMPENETRDMLLFRMMLELMRRPGAGVQAWVDAIPDGVPNNLKADAFERALALVVSLNPKLAMAWFDENKFSPHATGPAISTMLKGMIEIDSSEAVKWLVGLPPSLERDEGLREAVYTWLKIFPEEAHPFLRANLHRKELAPAIFPYAQFMVGRDPAESVEWARRIPHPLERVKVLSQALVTWGRIDRSAVVSWLRETPDVNDGVLEIVTDLLKISPEELS